MSKILTSLEGNLRHTSGYQGIRVSGNLILPGKPFSPRGYYSRHPEQVIHTHRDEEFVDRDCCKVTHQGDKLVMQMSHYVVSRIG